jgi:ABC-2 type transport system ATP-binding protein
LTPAAVIALLLRVTATLAAEDVHKKYGRRRVLCGASFEAHAGQLVAILGENGSGKSTLLRILAGADTLDRGRVRRSGRMGYCPQDPTLYPYLTLDEHLELFGRAYALEASVVRSRGDRLVEQFGLGPWRREIVERVSGGTRQKLSLAIALLHDPALVLLDEPYSGMDIVSYRGFLGWTEQARREGKCVVVITHLVLEKERFDAVVHLRDGKLHAEEA